MKKESRSDSILNSSPQVPFDEAKSIYHERTYGTLAVPENNSAPSFLSRLNNTTHPKAMGAIVTFSCSFILSVTALLIFLKKIDLKNNTDIHHNKDTHEALLTFVTSVMISVTCMLSAGMTTLTAQRNTITALKFNTLTILGTNLFLAIPFTLAISADSIRENDFKLLEFVGLFYAINIVTSLTGSTAGITGFRLFDALVHPTNNNSRKNETSKLIA